MKLRRVFGILFALCLAVGVLALSVSAETVANGTDGDGVRWTLDDKGTLTISGEGQMKNTRSRWKANTGKIKSVVIEDGVTSIGHYTFEGCSNLTSITIPDSVVSIGAYAFSDCVSLKSVKLPAKVSSIADYTFKGCSSLTGVQLPETLYSVGLYAFSKCSSLAQLELPDSTSYLGDAAFANCTALTDIDIPQAVTVIKKNLFRGCSSLTGVKIPKTVTSIEYGAFIECSSLVNIEIPDSVTNIADEVFAQCTSLQSVKIPRGAEFIGYRAFQNCTSLTNVEIPDTVTVIGLSAFEYCVNLENITIPESVTTIGFKAFRYSGLNNAEIPKSVEIIGNEAFYGCSGLSQIIFKGDAPSIGNDVFGGDYYSVSADAYYQGDNTTWTAETLQNYGGEINWIKVGKPKITAQPKTAVAKNGAAVTVKVVATGMDLDYRWYVKSVGSSSYKKSSITGPTYSVKMSSSVKDRLIYCIVTDVFGNQVKSKTVGLRMAVRITAQPKSMCAEMGKKVTAAVKAAGDGLKYAWYFKNKGSSKFTKSSISGAVYSMTLSKTTNGRQVYCVVTDKYGKKVTSETVSFGVPVKITTQPKTTYTKSGATAKVTVKAAGDGLKYTWYFKNKGASRFTKSSTTSAAYSVKMTSKTKDRQVYCVVKDKYGKSVKTNTATLRMAASITTQPKTVTVAKNKTAKVTVKAAGDGLKYTWYFKNKGASKFTKSSTTSAAYSVKMTSKVNGRQVYCVVKDKYGKTVKSSTATLKMK